MRQGNLNAVVAVSDNIRKPFAEHERDANERHGKEHSPDKNLQETGARIAVERRMQGRRTELRETFGLKGTLYTARYTKAQ